MFFILFFILSTIAQSVQSMPGHYDPYRQHSYGQHPYYYGQYHYHGQYPQAIAAASNPHGIQGPPTAQTHIPALQRAQASAAAPTIHPELPTTQTNTPTQASAAAPKLQQGPSTKGPSTTGRSIEEDYDWSIYTINPRKPTRLLNTKPL